MNSKLVKFFSIGVAALGLAAATSAAKANSWEITQIAGNAASTSFGFTTFLSASNDLHNNPYELTNGNTMTYTINSGVTFSSFAVTPLYAGLTAADFTESVSGNILTITYTGGTISGSPVLTSDIAGVSFTTSSAITTLAYASTDLEPDFSGNYSVGNYNRTFTFSPSGSTSTPLPAGFTSGILGLALVGGLGAAKLRKSVAC